MKPVSYVQSVRISVHNYYTPGIMNYVSTKTLGVLVLTLSVHKLAYSSLHVCGPVLRAYGSRLSVLSWIPL